MLVQPRRQRFKPVYGSVDTRPMVTLELTLAAGEAFIGDEQVADLGRRIAESPIRRYAGNGH